MPYLSHTGYQKMISVVKKQYYWPKLKSEAAEYIEKCMDYQRVKAEHHHSTGLMQPLPILEQKWETISIDFIIGFPKTNKQHDAIVVVVDKLSKVAHFIAIKSTFNAISITNIFMKEFFRLHGIPKIIIIYMDAKFTSHFWKELFTGLQS